MTLEDVRNIGFGHLVGFLAGAILYSFLHGWNGALFEPFGEEAGMTFAVLFAGLGGWVQGKLFKSSSSKMERFKSALVELREDWERGLAQDEAERRYSALLRRHGMTDVDADAALGGTQLEKLQFEIERMDLENERLWLENLRRRRKMKLPMGEVAPGLVTRPARSGALAQNPQGKTSPSKFGHLVEHVWAMLH
ncbi:hypothetical protein [Archangium lansingense]|uniref:SMODS and SLOG-associating 2TM effector domain-containing protein n=1 Tax=Archangium lansingense TaxID=2995310 RepID=A0ABT4AD30_9BACT|nr:hypothetical protein [Archangium lansinium]MCY1079577.1 hypothetical protein [Archangium lansinium]